MCIVHGIIDLQCFRSILVSQTLDMGENCLIPSQAFIIIPSLLLVNGILGYYQLYELAFFQRHVIKFFCVEFHSIVFRRQVKEHVKRRLQIPAPLLNLNNP